MQKFLIAGLLFAASSAIAEQVVDTQFTPQNTLKTFTQTNSPRVLVDAAHFNFHTLASRYAPFGKILQSDGYTLVPNMQAFSPEVLKQANILVIANALNEQNTENWDLPNYGAFTRAEIEAVFHWVKNGGSLLLIADHMPFPKASEELAAIFGFQFTNGYVEELDNREQIFSLTKGNLKAHPLLQGIDGKSPVASVKAFTGQAFLAPPAAKPLIVLGTRSFNLMPHKSWEFPDSTPEIDAEGWLQGATLKFHKGRIAVFGEAAMFSAQLSGEGSEVIKMGLNAEGAEQNEQFLLNVMHWLSHKIE
jgi:hypothetical protein